MKRQVILRTNDGTRMFADGIEDETRIITYDNRVFLFVEHNQPFIEVQAQHVTQVTQIIKGQ